MAAINITEKGVEVQVNGNTQQTYDQRANDATYDVSVTENGFVHNQVAFIDDYFLNESVSTTLSYTTGQVSQNPYWARMRWDDINGPGTYVAVKNVTDGTVVEEIGDPNTASGGIIKTADIVFEAQPNTEYEIQAATYTEDGTIAGGSYEAFFKTTPNAIPSGFGTAQNYVPEPAFDVDSVTQS